MPNHAILSVEETISVLNKTHLPTIIIEGIDDVVVYRKLEEIFLHIGLSVMGVGGRINLLQIFERVDEIQSKDTLAFIADLDTWVFSGPPEKYTSENLIFTKGYSVENDVFQDCAIENVMTEIEKRSFLVEVEKFSHWYALAVDRLSREIYDMPLSTYPGIILDGDLDTLTALGGEEVYPIDLKQVVVDDYSTYIRGKSLMQIVARQISRKGRAPRVNPDLFLGIASARPGPNLVRIFSRIGDIFDSEYAAVV